MLHKIHVSHLVFLGFFVVMWLVVIFSKNKYEDVFLSIFLLACCVIALFVPQLRRPVRTQTRSADGTIQIGKFNVNIITNLFIFLEKKIVILSKIRMFNENLVASLVFRTGRNFDPEEMTTNMSRISFAAFIPSVVIGIYLGITVSPAFLAVCAVPLAFFFQPYMQLRLAIIERKSKIEEEMAYFLCYVNIMQTIGFGLYKAFDMIRGEHVFAGMERDASEIIKRVKMLGVTQNESLSIYANTHPSETFRNYIAGYVAKITSVGDVPQYTESKAKFFFSEYVGLWKRYEKSAQEIFSSIMMISIILPMMIMFTSLLGTPETSGLLLVVGTVISPFVSMAMIIVLNMSQPATGNLVKFSPLGPVAGVVVGVSLFLAAVDPASAIAGAFLSGAVVNLIMTRKNIQEIQIIDSMLPEFMYDVTELSKSGENINQIIVKQAKKNAYKPQFNKLLEDIASKIAIGQAFDQVVKDIKHKSMNIKFIMFLLAKTYSTGSGRTEIFLLINEFVTQSFETKKQVTKSLKSLNMIVYASPFIMLGIAHMMIAMFTGGLDTAGDGGGSIGDVAFLGNFGALDERFISGISVMAALSSIPIGFVASKISSYTIKDTLPVAIVSVMTILAINILPVIAGMVEFG